MPTWKLILYKLFLTVVIIGVVKLFLFVFEAMVARMYQRMKARDPRLVQRMPSFFGYTGPGSWRRIFMWIAAGYILILLWFTDIMTR
ncbi:MAG TPA: hypothetical protein VHL57_10915 [Flavobacteriales bacterium]|jgi:hypothetical protein|nr:hypothetical protein [Flavobacteriales bacterium]